VDDLKPARMWWERELEREEMLARHKREERIVAQRELITLLCQVSTGVVVAALCYATAVAIFLLG
jgi:hypothetical protein